MPVWICATCGNHYGDRESPPEECAICADERQWVPSSGPRWTTAAELAAAGHRSDISVLSQVPVLDLTITVVGVPAAAALVGWVLAGRKQSSIARQALD